MKDSTHIKKQNKSLIRKLLLTKKQYTKQQIAQITGLSVASCNTYLNEMEQSGEVLGEKRQLREVGRSSIVYHLNEAFESILCIYFEWILGTKSVTATVLSPSGQVRIQQKKSFSKLDYPVIEQEILSLINQYSNVSQIIVGTPSVAENGVIRHCDIPELEDIPLVRLLEARFQLPVFLANDMHYKVYGYYRQTQQKDTIVTLVNFPSGILPGTATVHKGCVLTGKNLFAGMVGFLDYGIAQTDMLAALHNPVAQPLIEQATIALIAILNPHKILFTGDLLKEETITQIQQRCKRCIPEEYMPEFAFLPNTDSFYLAGMYWKAISRKETEG